MTLGAAGDLDPTFDGDGKVVTDLGGDETAAALAVQPDGRVVAAGYTGAGGGTSADFALARYNSNGSLDPAFDGDGKVLTDFGSLDYAFDVALQADGKIVAAGWTGADSRFVLARYKPDGSLDPTFDGEGKLVVQLVNDGIGFSNEGITEFSVAIQADGKIVAAGSGVGGDDNGNFVLARYNADGSLDPTFDGNGIASTEFICPFVTAYDVAIQADGKIVVAGQVCFNTALARYNADGSLDPTFGSDGTVVKHLLGDDAARDIAIRTDGKIVVAAAESSPSAEPDDFVLARFTAGGSLDPSFDGDGSVFTDFGGRDLARGLAIQADGTLVVAGFSNAGANPGNFALARYRPGGGLDPTFDGDGKLLTDFGASEAASAVAIQAGSKVVAAGGSGGDFALARYVAFSCGGAPATIVGTAGNDNLTGTAGNDVIAGFGGNDTISGLGGNDKICGGLGNDTLGGGSGADQFNGGTGIDTATYAGYTSGITVDIDGVPDDGNAADGAAGARDNVKTDVENLIGGKGPDTLGGSAANNHLTGGLGADSLLGLGGDDTLFANDGTADTQIDCDGGAADTAHVDPSDPATVACETVGP